MIDLHIQKTHPDILGINMNDRELKSVIEKEFKFLSRIFDQTKLFRQSETVQEKDTNVQVTNKSGKIKMAKDIKQAQRAKTLEELYQRLDTFKDKKSIKYGPNHEKNLKKKIKKKTKLLKAKEEKKKMHKRMMKEKKSERRQEEEEKQKELEKFNKEVKPKLESMRSDVKSSEEPTDRGSIVYNKIDVVHDAEEKKHKDRPMVALQKLEKTNRLISKLKEKGNVERAEKIKQHVIWSNVLDKAEGVKVKDDKEKIKKSIKKVEERKKKSEKKWKERLESTQKRMDMKQKKRKDNLKQRKTEKIKKKIKKSVKKGRTLPGVNDK